MTIKVDERIRAAYEFPTNVPNPYTAFLAGWNAHEAHTNHEWGPAPSSNVQSAYNKWYDERMKNNGRT